MPKRFDPELIPPFPTLEFERVQWQQGLRVVAGLDEAGRGSLAGPLCAAVVILPFDADDLEKQLIGVKDSKQMTPFERETLAPVIKSVALDFAIAWMEPDEIDNLGMGKAGRVVFKRAVSGLRESPVHLLIDYFKVPELEIPQTCLVKGDQRSLSIACASVLAKQARDQRMIELSAEFEGYHFEQNKGYASPEHLKAIDELGLCVLHRHSFCDHLLQGRLFKDLSS